MTHTSPSAPNGNDTGGSDVMPSRVIPVPMMKRIPGAGVPRGPAPMRPWQWAVIGGIVLACITLVGLLTYRDAMIYERRCQRIAVVGQCTGGDFFGHGVCRIKTEQGARITVSAPVMVGDEACWREPVEE